MKILSIDVGIKNLAFCLFDTLTDDGNDNIFQIIKWNVVDISEEHDILTCMYNDKVTCNKPAKYKKKSDCFCLKHAKKQGYKLPTKETTISYINKQKKNTLIDIADNYKLTHDTSMKKDKLVHIINDYIAQNFFDEIKTNNASTIDLINVGRNLKTKFNDLFTDQYLIDHIIIENQISPIANRMKTIQGMVVQYFIMSDINVPNIEFISASNKLKICDNVDKTKYKDRKKLSIQLSLDHINNNPNYNNQISYFMSHNKKDDLADCFLQGLWFINNKINKF